MPLRNCLSLLLVAFAVSCMLNVSASADDLPAIPPIKRLLPPPGIEVPEDVRKELETKLNELAPRVQRIVDPNDRAETEVFLKAVRFALRFDEFYEPKDFEKARWALSQAEVRLKHAEAGKRTWLGQTGPNVLGYYSEIDGSVQPVGVVIPADFDFSKLCSKIVFLHGRGDKQTDLHFLYERAHKVGEVPAPPGTIVVHPFGRHCVGFKSAGEIDVYEALHHTVAYPSRGRPALMGFSMGGAGAWHIGAHYSSDYSGVFPGAGFVDVARYQKLKPERYPPEYEQTLWQIYDVPNYTRNLFNLPVVAYSGELDKQKDAADLMAESFQREGRELKHLIGPKTEHKYHPETKKQLLAEVDKVLQADIAQFGKMVIAPEAHLQTRTLRYNGAGWFTAYGLAEHWQDARLDGKHADGRFTITTKNVTRFSVTLIGAPEPRTFVIDDKPVEAKLRQDELSVDFELQSGQWTMAKPIVAVRGNTVTFNTLAGKRPRMQGPIDDAFLEPFVVVLPTGKSQNPRVQQWIDFEIAHLRERWAALFRGDLPVILDTEVQQRHYDEKHLICFGDATSNQVIKQALPKLPIAWSERSLTLAGKKYDALTHVPLLIYPNPLQPEGTRQRKYIVLNSGPTFREAHDRTNSLQNPKLPDWAIIDITTPPDGEKPGKVVAADFFDEQWQVKKK